MTDNQTQIESTPAAQTPTTKKDRKRSRAMRNLMNRNGVWYFKKMINGKVSPVSLGTSDLALAKAKRDENEGKVTRKEFDKIRGVRAHSATVGDVVKLFTKCGGITDKAIKGNKSALKTICRIALGKDHPDDVSLDELTRKTARDYQDKVRATYEAAAGPNEKDRRMARDRADRTTKSTLRQARSMFCKRRDLTERYREAGLIIPEGVFDFCAYKGVGTMTSKVYFPPSDAILLQTFTKVEELRTGVGEEPADIDAYALFWTALGTGCRRSEVLDMKRGDFIEIEGRLWIGAGLGKDGKMIQIPVINWPVHPSSNVIPEQVIREALARAKNEGRETLFPGKLWERTERLARRLNDWLTTVGWRDEKKLHALRAFIGSKIYSQKPRMAQIYLRHKSIATTEKFYSHFVSLEGVFDLMPTNVVPMPQPDAAAPIASHH
jgi:integrase